MPNYKLPTISERPALEPKTVWLVASGDLRQSPNTAGWPTQEKLERSLTSALADLGWSTRRAHAYDPVKGHGFIDSQRMGMSVFAQIPVDAPLVVAETVWQYSHHVLAGLRSHRGPVLTVANFDGTWPGLVGLLNLNASMTKMGREYSTIWSTDFTDEWFRGGIKQWTETGKIVHDASHVRPLPALPVSSPEFQLGLTVANKLRIDKAILGVFDEGCMGMYNAIIDDDLLNGIGIYKERLSQSALYAEMARVGEEETTAVRRWLSDRGMTFCTGKDEATELTDEQLRQQFAMYIAALTDK